MQMNPLWWQALLALHVAAGMLSFVLAPIVLAASKGGRVHKRWGLVYFWSMGVVAATALPMALFLPVLFLALVAVFSFYLTFSGYRILRLKDLARGGSARPVDWAAAIVTFGCCAGLAGCGWLRPAWVQNMGPVAVTLGLVGMRGAGADMVRFVRKPTERMFWLYVHLERFIGSYIAAWTAFSAVTLSRVFEHAGLVIWLWPIALGVPATAITIAYYRRRFARLPASAAA